MKTKPKTKSPETQSWAEQLIAVMTALTPGATKPIPEKVFQDAAVRVGTTSAKRLEWALRFAQAENMTPGDIYNFELEIGAFLHPDLPFAEKGGARFLFREDYFLFPNNCQSFKKNLCRSLGEQPLEVSHSA